MVQTEARHWSREQLGFDLTGAKSVSVIWPSFESLDCFAVIHHANGPQPAAVAIEVQRSLPRLQPSGANAGPALQPANVGTTLHRWVPLEDSNGAKWRHKKLPWTFAALEQDWVALGESNLIDEALKHRSRHAAEVRTHLQTLKELNGHVLLTADWSTAPQGIYHRFPGLFAFAQGQDLCCWAHFGDAIAIHGKLEFEDQDQAGQACETSRMFVAMARGILLKQNQLDVAALEEESGLIRPGSLLLQLAGRRQFEAMLESIKLRQQGKILIWRGTAPSDSVAWLLALSLISR